MVIISKHQGNFDIPIYIACLPFSVGFIAKHQLRTFPIINIWMIAMDCIFINRKRLRESTKKINERIHQKDKNPIFIFPEGTRSKGAKLSPFKPGSLKMLFQARADVLPITINGSYKCMELHRHVKNAHIELFYQPVLHSSNYHIDDFVNMLAIFVAVIVNFVLGFLWFTPLFGKIWGKEMGYDPNMKPEKSVFYQDS